MAVRRPGSLNRFPTMNPNPDPFVPSRPLIRSLRGMAGGLFLPLIASADLPEGRSGIAAGFPGDAGIAGDSRVVFVEDFEEETLEALWSRWDSVADQKGQSFSADRPAGSSGRHSLRMLREEGSGASLYRRLTDNSGKGGYDRLFARYYVKFAEDCGVLHHFGTCIGGNLPATPWPVVRAGEAPDGARGFWSGIEPYGDSWTWDYYTYWCGMRGSPPRGRKWGNSFIRNPDHKVIRNRWICIEHMIRMNSPEKVDGEQALWIDGMLVSHLGAGFPSGLWTYDKFTPGRGGEGVRWDDTAGKPERFTTPDGGEPFRGFRWRTAPELNINFVWLYIYTERPAGHRICVWFDHVVLATDYIGPLTPAPEGEKAGPDNPLRRD